MDSITDSREWAHGVGALSLQALWVWGRGQQGIVAAGEDGLHSRGWTGHIWCCDQSGKVTEMDGGDLKEVEEKHVFSDGGGYSEKDTSCWWWWTAGGWWCLIVKGIKTQTDLGRGGVWEWLRHLEEEEGRKGGHRTVGASTFIADAFAKDSQSLSSGFHVFLLRLSLDAQLHSDCFTLAFSSPGLS